MFTPFAALILATSLVTTASSDFPTASPETSDFVSASKTPQRRGRGASKKQLEPEAKASKRREVSPSLKSVSITSEMFEVMPNAEQAVWTGSVVATQEDIRIECDRLVASFGENHRIRAIDCVGNVHMVQRREAEPEKGVRAMNREAWGQKAHFDNAKSLVTVTGDPMAKEGTSTVRGERVLIYVSDERIVVEKPRMVFETNDAVGGKL